jgi:hypothetical protein
MALTQQVILGSGELYIVKYDGSAIPADATLEVEANHIASIKGGASLEYKPIFAEVVDDNRKILKRFITSEETTFKSGILSWSLDILQKLCAACDYSDNATTGMVELKLGGRTEIDAYVIRFVHTLSDGNKIRVTLVGTATNGFQLAFKADAETVIDAEFKALSTSDGTQVIITQSYDIA